MDVRNKIHPFFPQTCSLFWILHFLNSKSQGHPWITQEEPLGNLDFVYHPPYLHSVVKPHGFYPSMMSRMSSPSFPLWGASPDAWLSPLEHEPAWWPPLDFLPLVTMAPHDLTLPGSLRRRHDTRWGSILVRDSGNPPWVSDCWDELGKAVGGV